MEQHIHVPIAIYICQSSSHRRSSGKDHTIGHNCGCIEILGSQHCYRYHPVRLEINAIWIASWFGVNGNHYYSERKEDLIIPLPDNISVAIDLR